jgi:hypothetical protein
MLTRVEKAERKRKAKKPTSSPEVQTTPEMTARMHFYAVRSTGDQLRWADAPKTGKKPDRMVGR